jgi:small subunit ribosomal protein S1
MEQNDKTVGSDGSMDEDSMEQEVHPMDALLAEEDYGLESPRRGQIRTGTIARITDSDVLVDIGYKSEGVIPSRELEKVPDEERAALAVGQEASVYVLHSGGADGTIILSLTRAEEENDWAVAEKLLESKEPFEGVVSGYNKGGLIVKLGRLRGFIPASQVSMSRRWRAEGESPDQRWSKMVGEPVVSKVIEVDRRRNRLILSERAAAREAREVLKERLISELQAGEIRTGHVNSLADFGAFVDIGGADGLVHTSEITWKRITHPREVLKVGQEVQVKVLGVDAEQKRISLSMRDLESDPWEQVLEVYGEGQLVNGTITKLTKFGAFASLQNIPDFEVEGLIHISELADRHIVHPREVVAEGETLTLRIIKVESKRRRIGLSLKRVDSSEYRERDFEAAMQELDAPATTEVAEAEVEEVAEAEVVEVAEAEAEGADAAEVDVAEAEAEVEEVAEAEVEEVAEAEVEEVAEAEVEEVAEAEVEEVAEAEVEEVAEAEVEEVAEAEVEEVAEAEVEEVAEAEVAEVAEAEAEVLEDAAEDEGAAPEMELPEEEPEPQEEPVTSDAVEEVGTDD